MFFFHITTYIPENFQQLHASLKEDRCNSQSLGKGSGRQVQVIFGKGAEVRSNSRFPTELPTEALFGC